MEKNEEEKRYIIKRKIFVKEDIRTRKQWRLSRFQERRLHTFSLLQL